jgi:hypothetical protein
MAPPISPPASKAVAKHEALAQKSHVRGITPSAVNPGKSAAETVGDDKEVSLQDKAVGAVC